MTETVLDRPAAQTTAATILQRAVCLTLECHYLGNHRTVDLAAVVQAAAPDREAAALAVDEEQFNAVKRLVDPKELRPAMHVFGLVKAYLRSRAIPTHRVFGERSYLIPLALVDAVDAQLVSYVLELEAEADGLSDRYAAAVAAQAGKLGPLFDARDYKTPAEVAAAFRLDWSYVSFAAPERLEAVSSVIYRAAQEKHARRMAEAYDEVKLVLRETLRQVTATMAEKLAPGADGKPKVLRGTALRDLADFLSTFDLRNITDDDALKAEVDRLRRLTGGLDVEALRDDAALRARVREEMAAATAQLADLVATGRRGISFGALDG